MVLNLANKITLGRVLFVPVIIVLLHWPNKVFCLVATICLALACISDMLDGWVARREKQVTRFGKFLDPLADKLLVCSVLVMLTRLGWIPAWVTIVIIGRELIVTGLRAMAADQGVVIAADKYGKLKTILQSIALILLTLHYEWFGLSPVLPGEIALYLALAVTIFSGANYLKVFHTHWLEGVVATSEADNSGREEGSQNENGRGDKHEQND
ncbi:MAG: CDP-diacylglycerol--glycerol-3-phosphate 3-phosphatidyltransferase [Desulfovibrionaceae bacterium]|nr:CDP-diacylglycerol--glycerol-3-phosphate 3-phosphatidyltransferase [Desulfovibrionaceae bacterium]